MGLPCHFLLQSNEHDAFKSWSSLDSWCINLIFKCFLIKVPTLSCSFRFWKSSSSCSILVFAAQVAAGTSQEKEGGQAGDEASSPTARASAVPRSGPNNPYGPFPDCSYLLRSCWKSSSLSGWWSCSKSSSLSGWWSCWKSSSLSGWCWCSRTRATTQRFDFGVWWGGDTSLKTCFPVCVCSGLYFLFFNI